MPAIDPRGLLTDDLLARFARRAVDGSRTDGGALAGDRDLAADLDELRNIGYFTIALPAKSGGHGFSLPQVACAQRRLAYHAPLTALAVSPHLYWTGAAADAYQADDSSVRWILGEAARGALFGSGHGQPGSDLVFAAPHTRPRPHPRAPDARTPGPDWRAVHSVAGAGIILEFVPRSGTPRIARVLPPGPPADMFTSRALGWGLPLLASVDYAIARRAFDTALSVASRRPARNGHPLDQWPVAEASLRLDGIRAEIDAVLHAPGTGGQWLIRLCTARHIAADGARRVIGLAAQIAGSSYTLTGAS